MNMTPEQRAAYIAEMESDDRKAMTYGGLALLITFLVIWWAYAGVQRDTKRVSAMQTEIPQGCHLENSTNQWGWPETHTVCK